MDTMIQAMRLMISPFEKGGLRGIFNTNKIPRQAKKAWHPFFLLIISYKNV
jgi:hypothetical protein